jgi:putative endonuclease
MWRVYVVECSDDSLYCGISTDVERRVLAHNSGRGAKYTRSRRPVRLVACSSASFSRSVAQRLESSFKKLRRVEKLRFLAAGIDTFLEQYLHVQANDDCVD